jgi:prolyl-tRNA synthetase
MRFSKYYIKTLKEVPKEADVTSHILMMRAGMIKKLASGIYSYLPLGYKVIKKLETIIREEMDNAGAHELFMPVLQPAELWKETGRWEAMGPEMIRLKDRHNRDFILGPTHEEVITDIIRNDISSYKSLPFNLYQIQTKFRDERRPRFGLMRGREFSMTDGYSFHTTQECLDKEFNNMKEAYGKVFDRCGLHYRPVEADSGAIGGSGSQEFHVLADSGEDEIIFCDSCNYASNLEAARSKLENAPKEELKEASLLDTPNISKIDDVVNYLKVPVNKTVKAMMYRDVVNDDIYMVLIRGDFEVNEVKLRNLIDTIDVIMLTDEELINAGLIKGYIGPYGIDLTNIKVIADNSILEISNHTAGGNKIDTHYMDVNYGRDYTANLTGDVRSSKPGETCSKCDGQLQSARGIETGHIFKLGTKYSISMKATYLNENGIAQPIIMGCYGLGVTRTVAAAIEQSHDENGIIWPISLAPFIVDVIPASLKDEVQMNLAEEIYSSLKKEGIDTIIDDRDERVGFKFKDADLIGIPFKIISGKRASEGIVEIKVRKTGESFEINKNEVLDKIQELIKKY